MKWLDLKVWEDLLEFLANHFVVPLSLTRFDHKIAIIEWERFKTYLKANFEDSTQVCNEMDVKRISYQAMKQMLNEYGTDVKRI